MNVHLAHLITFALLLAAVLVIFIALWHAGPRGHMGLGWRILCVLLYLALTGWAMYLYHGGLP